MNGTDDRMARVGMALWALGAAAALGGCTEEAPLPTCGAQLTLRNVQHDELIRVMGLEVGQDCTVSMAAQTNVLVEVAGPTEGISLSLGAVAETEAGWIRPHLAGPGDHALAIRALRPMGAFDVLVHNRAPPAASGLESVLLKDPGLLADGFLLNLGMVMAKVADDQHGGRMLAEFLQRFATTTHSVRTGPRALYDKLVADYGPDPSLWALHVLPFKVVGVANRLDLADGASCGQVWITFSATDPAYQPFHLAFAFTQPPRPTDVSPHQLVHCEDTARSWSRIHPDIQGETLYRLWSRIQTSGQFVTLQTSEAIGAPQPPWEFREWRKAPGAAVLDNVPMPQSVDIPRLNAPGPDRDAFLTFVAQHAAALDAYRMPIEPRFLALSARVASAATRETLDLTGLPSGVAAQFPTLRQKIELSGCPACHVADAPFQQLGADATPSPFYSKELNARLGLLLDMADGVSPLPNAVTVFGPRQALPVLPQ